MQPPEELLAELDATELLAGLDATELFMAAPPPPCALPPVPVPLLVATPPLPLAIVAEPVVDDWPPISFPESFPHARKEAAHVAPKRKDNESLFVRIRSSLGTASKRILTEPTGVPLLREAERSWRISTSIAHCPAPSISERSRSTVIIGMQFEVEWVNRLAC